MYSKTDINNQSKLLLYSFLNLTICLLSRDELKNDKIMFNSLMPIKNKWEY